MRNSHRERESLIACQQQDIAYTIHKEFKHKIITSFVIIRNYNN